MRTKSLLFVLVAASYDLAAAQLENALATLSNTLDDLAWKISPLAILKSLTLGDIENPENITKLDNLNPPTKSPTDLLLRPYTLAPDTKLVTVLKQTGTLCGYHAVKNMVLILSALTAQSRTEAYSWLRRMFPENMLVLYRNRMGKKCAASNFDIEEFFIAVRTGHVTINGTRHKFFSHLLMSDPIESFIKQNSEFVMVLDLNRARTGPNITGIFDHSDTKKILIERIQEFKKAAGTALLPIIILASEEYPSNAFNAHFISFIAVKSGEELSFLLADSLAEGNAYGIPAYINEIIDLFKK